MKKTCIDSKYTHNSLIEENENTAISIRDIHNEWLIIRRDNLGEKRPIQALFKTLINDSVKREFKAYYNSFHGKERGPLTHLLIMHKKHKKLFHLNPEVIVLDCTYKTNRFSMPLLNMVGIISTNKSFFAASAFMPKETDGNFKWYLK